jgi:glutamate carboxypeptidase
MNPSPAARRLWDRACEAARQLGIELDEGRSGGVSDANTISQYTPTLDGLGPVGDGAHARHEFCYVDKMVERSALLALLLASPPLPDEAPASDATTDATSLSSPS